jgi:hypothetical protein
VLPLSTVTNLILSENTGSYFYFAFFNKTVAMRAIIQRVSQASVSGTCNLFLYVVFTDALKYFD